MLSFDILERIAFVSIPCWKKMVFSIPGLDSLRAQRRFLVVKIVEKRTRKGRGRLITTKLGRKLHSLDDKPAKIYISFEDEMEVQSEKWYYQGLLHRDRGLPASVITDSKRGILMEWYRRDLPFRDNDLPTIVKEEDGERVEMWTQFAFKMTSVIRIKGVYAPKEIINYSLSREKGPAYIRYSEGREISVWFLNGKQHRKNGPAVTVVEKGEKVLELWFLNGKQHRKDGPCYENFATGKKKYFLHGRKVNPVSSHCSYIVHADTMLERGCSTKGVHEMEGMKFCSNHKKLFPQ